MTNALPDYSTYWKEYRKRRDVYVVFLMLSVPYAFVAIHIASWVPYGVLVGAWIVAFTFLKNYIEELSCPRCDKDFFPRIWFGLRFLLPTLQQRCDNCGLAKYSNAPDEPNAPTPQQVVR